MNSYASPTSAIAAKGTDPTHKSSQGLIEISMDFRPVIPVYTMACMYRQRRLLKVNQLVNHCQSESKLVPISVQSTVAALDHMRHLAIMLKCLMLKLGELRGLRWKKTNS